MYGSHSKDVLPADARTDRGERADLGVSRLRSGSTPKSLDRPPKRENHSFCRGTLVYRGISADSFDTTAQVNGNPRPTKLQIRSQLGLWNSREGQSRIERPPDSMRFS